MNRMIEKWCYGDTDKKFFNEQEESIHKYNSKMMDKLLLIMTIIMLIYFVASTRTSIFSQYLSIYLGCFTVLFIMMCTFKTNISKSVKITKVYMFLFFIVMFIFVCVLGTLFEPGSRATLFIVYVLVLPMMFIIPTHYIYSFLLVATAIFSFVALQKKELAIAQMDIIHSSTCLVIGLFICHHILVSRMAIYSTNEQLDKRNLELENENIKRISEKEELRLRLEQHQIIMDQTTDILFEWDIRTDKLIFSSNWRKKFGYTPIENEISEKIPLSDNIYNEDMPAFVKIMRDTAAGVPYSETEFRIRDSEGKYNWCRIRATAQFDSSGAAVKAVGVILNVDAEKKEKQYLLKMAQRDPLTGIYNKTATNAIVSRQMESFDFTVLQALMIIDIDHFKQVNDTYGHIVGDTILASVATQLKNSTRTSDVVGRIGGDEFLVYLTEVFSDTDAISKANDIAEALSRLKPKPGEPHITSSIGLSVVPHGSIDYYDLYRCADKALYKRKNLGRNGVTLYTADME